MLEEATERPTENGICYGRAQIKYIYMHAVYIRSMHIYSMLGVVVSIVSYTLPGRCAWGDEEDSWNCTIPQHWISVGRSCYKFSTDDVSAIQDVPSDRWSVFSFYIPLDRWSA